MTRVLRAVGALTAVAIAAAVAVTPTPAGSEQDAEPVWSVQLHVHGSFSEGVGSIDSHTHEASELGVDAIWWSDHDYRISSYRHVSSFGYEDWQEPIDRNEPWSAWNEKERSYRKTLLDIGVPRYEAWSADDEMEQANAWFTRGRAVEGRRCLSVRGVGESESTTRRLFAINTDRAVHQRSLATRVVVNVSVRPESAGPDGSAIVEMGLSEHPPRRGLAFDTYGLRYVLVQEEAAPYLDGTVLCVPLVCRLGEWNHYALPVTRDVVAGLDFLPGEDNNLKWVAVGVQARNGVEVTASFDDLRIEQELRGSASFDRQREVLAEVGRLYPGVAQLQGVEISYLGPHLNEFSLETELVDIDRLVSEHELAKGDPPEVDNDALADLYVRSSVEAAHARGGLISLNHVYGARQAGRKGRREREDVLARALEEELLGADLLEVGYRDRGGHDLDDHLWIWDELAKAGRRPVGIGVSDSHGGPDHRWATAANNFVTWIHAPAATKPDLLEGLRAGRAYFGDIVLFDGRIDLETPQGFRMGQVVITDREQLEVRVDLRGLAKGDRVRLVEAGGRTAERVADEADLAFTLHLAPSTASTFARVEVYASDGRAKAFGNPIHFVRGAPERALAPARAGLDVAGVHSTELRGFELHAATALEDGAAGVEVRGRASGGTLVLDCTALGTPEAELAGLTGEWDARGSTLELRGLEGQGRITVRPAR